MGEVLEQGPDRVMNAVKCTIIRPPIMVDMPYCPYGVGFQGDVPSRFANARDVHPSRARMPESSAVTRIQTGPVP